jgi:hypothetical protein
MYNIQLLDCAFCLCEPERTAGVSVCVWDERERVVRTRAWRIPHNTRIFPLFWTRPASAASSSSVYTRESTSLDYRVPTTTTNHKRGGSLLFIPHSLHASILPPGSRSSIAAIGRKYGRLTRRNLVVIYFFSRVAGLFLSFFLVPAGVSGFGRCCWLRGVDFFFIPTVYNKQRERKNCVNIRGRLLFSLCSFPLFFFSFLMVPPSFVHFRPERRSPGATLLLVAAGQLRASGLHAREGGRGSIERERERKRGCYKLG